jgi:predicted alpha/beta superfamily hydrolase
MVEMYKMHKYTMKKLLLAALFSITVLTLFAQKDGNKVKPFVLGTIHEISSKELSEKRILNIYLPEGYNEKDTARYPVIYLLDGSADEDFIHVTGLVQFLNFPWVNLLEKSIVVGIGSVDRRRDFTFPTTIEKDKKDFPTTGGSAKFIAFIEKELQPYIDKQFKTTSSRTIIGQSLGGLLATEILFTKPALFTRYIIVSPSLWWDNESLLARQAAVVKDETPGAASVYIAAGSKEEKIMLDDAKRLSDILSSGSNKKLDVKYDILQDEDHATILHRAVYKAFEHLGKKR